MKKCVRKNNIKSINIIYIEYVRKVKNIEYRNCILDKATKCITNSLLQFLMQRKLYVVKESYAL